MTTMSALAAESLVFDGVSHRFGAKTALNDVTFTAQAGTVTAILGQSGSGKSTLLRVAAGLERPQAGRISLGARVLFDDDVFLPAEKRRVAMMFQDYALFPHLTVGGNVAFGLSATNRDTARAQARDWLQRVGLSDRQDSFPHQLSGGEQQRVSLVRALASQPRAVLLDEPFSGLDRELRLMLRDSALQTLREAGVTAIFVTHDADDAMYAADQIIILHAGAIVQSGAPRSVYDEPNSLRAALGLGPLNQFKGRVQNGRVETPFGAAPCALADGAMACVGVRPEAIGLAPGDFARIVSRRPAGAYDLLAIEAGGVVWTAFTAVESGPRPGDAVGVSFATRGVHVFPA